MSCSKNRLTKEGYCMEELPEEIKNLMDLYGSPKDDSLGIFLFFNSTTPKLNKCKGPSCKHYVDMGGRVI
jgi:hypothetical protein